MSIPDVLCVPTTRYTVVGSLITGSHLTGLTGRLGCWLPIRKVIAIENLVKVHRYSFSWPTKSGQSN